MRLLRVMSCATCTPSADAAFDSGCACDHGRFPPCMSIAAALPSLQRQMIGFPQYREHLLSSASRRAELAGWQGRAEDDLGVMLLESWAYVLDILQFYDERIANESYVRTATLPESMRNLVALLGYRPRPAVAATMTLAVHADGHDPVALPAGIRLRSKSADGVPPQIFETSVNSVIWPQRNVWELTSERKPHYTGIIAFAPRAPGVLPGQVVAVLHNNSLAGAARVETVETQRLKDGQDYRVAKLSAELLNETWLLEDIDILIMSQSAGRFSTDSTTTTTGFLLDGNYPQIQAGEMAVLEIDDAYQAAEIDSAGRQVVNLAPSGDAINSIVTKVEISPSLSFNRLHFRASNAGRLINPAETTRTVASLVGDLPIKTPVPPLTGAPEDGRMIATGAGKKGALLEGAYNPIDAEIGAVSASQQTAEALVTPVACHGNVIEATRGETVREEVLGSGDPSKPYLRFRLKKKPLTYLTADGQPDGIAPVLEVRVNGILWKRIECFSAAREGERVYVIRHDEAGETDIIFGEKARPDSGVKNITASYRHGAGALSPPPGKLDQFADRVPGLGKAVAPLAARGGADAESTTSLRENAGRKAMTTGRAVSLADYRAQVAAYPGVINSDVQWRLVPGEQRAAVAAVVISQSGDVSADLAAFLAGSGDPMLPVSVTAAVAEAHLLNVEIHVASVYDSTMVVAAVVARLSDPQDGLLSPRKVAIGGALFASAIAAAVASVEGVADVSSILLDGITMPTAMSVPAGSYPAFTVAVASAGAA